MPERGAVLKLCLVVETVAHLWLSLWVSNDRRMRYCA